MQQQEEQNKPNQIPMPKKGGKVPSSTERIPAASSSFNFKGDSIALKKKRRIDAMFSDDEGSSDATSSRKAGSARHHRLNSTGTKSNRMSHLAAPSDNLSAKEKLKLEFDPSALRSLNENKKDVRTIEEIEQDLRRKQALAQPASAAPPPSQGLFASRRSAGINSQPAGGSSQASSSALAIDASPKDRSYAMDGKSKGKWPVDIKRKRTASPTEDSLRKPSSKLKSPPAASVRQRDSASSSDTLPKLSKAEARRQEIWAILNPHKANAPVFGYNDDDFSDEDMEAGIDDIEEEDRRAARIARLEDKKEEDRLKQRAKEKAARKSGAKQ